MSGENWIPVRFQKEIVLIESPSRNSGVDRFDRLFDSVPQPNFQPFKEGFFFLNAPSEHERIAKSQHAQHSRRFFSRVVAIPESVSVDLDRNVERAKSFKTGNKFMPIVVGWLVPDRVIDMIFRKGMVDDPQGQFHCKTGNRQSPEE